MGRGGWGGEWLVVLRGVEGEVSVLVMLRVFWQFSSGGVDHLSRHPTHSTCSGGGWREEHSVHHTMCMHLLQYVENTTPELAEVIMYCGV